MKLRELLQVVDSEIYIIDEDCEIAMVNTEYCNFERDLSDEFLDKKVLCVYVHDNKLKVITSAG